jgi:hypothetical protein
MKSIKLNILAMLFAICEMSCQPCDDEETVPTYLDGCIDDLYPGGIAGWFAVKCDAPFTDITDEAEWDAKIAAGEVFGRFDGEMIRGSLPVPERAKVPVGACGVEKTISKTYTATLFDSAYEATNTKYDLYDYLDRKGSRWLFGLIQCDGNTYGPFANVTAEPDENIPETNAEVKAFQFILSWKQGLGVPKPVLLPFLVGKQLHP